MDLVNEYLRVIAALLPKGQREDIIAELRDTILTRIEAREAELGRKFTPDETEALLRDMGHPLVVAGWYSDGPQQVVGPTLYPYWAFVVKVAITIQVIVGTVVLFARTLNGEEFGQALGQALGYGLSGVITVIGLATVAAWLIERFKIRIAYFDEWRVRDLHLLEFAFWDWNSLRERMEGRTARTTRDAARRAWRLERRLARRDWRSGPSPIGRALGAIAVGTVMVLWWIGVLRFGVVGTMDDLRELSLDPGPLQGVDWIALQQALFWPVLGYGVAVILQGVAMLMYPRAVWLRGLTNLVIGGGLLAICGWIWTASPLAAAVHVDSVTGLAIRVKDLFQHGSPRPLASVLTLMLACVAFSALCRVVRGLFQLLPSAPEGEGAALG
ncbi:MAG: hypothetical protein ABIO39_15075 [Caulobacteraceae bacterium]